MAVQLPPFPLFNPDTDPTSVSQRWFKWVQCFTNFLLALNIDDKKRQRALLLHYAGEKVYVIFDTRLTDTGDDFETAVTKLTAHFSPKKNVDFETYRFRQATQLSGETIDQFVTRLRQLAAFCEFHNSEREIKAQVIQSCSSTRLRRRALREEKITLDELLKFSRALEVSEHQAQSMENGKQPDNSPKTGVNSLSYNNNRGNKHGASKPRGTLRYGRPGKQTKNSERKDLSRL